ncbi:MAG: hypothetical protein AAGA56_26760 [Myxococcota bacterium]
MEGAEWHGRGFAYLDGARVKEPSDDALRDELAAELWRDANRLVRLKATETSLPLA